MENFADLYTDYPITSTSYTTATGMASMLSIKHDRITRALSTGDYDSKFLWNRAKVYVQEVTQSRETVFLTFDDSIRRSATPMRANWTAGTGTMYSTGRSKGSIS